eukprot:TRINITY_DN3055_c0_g1_i1.p1 TRINITY_DN3055_c0_g1~~TRINITY_DN3055_c0_g1_i1.p1  ORF type:complete len:566 (+),score=136.58 TRINITY_DN3055_c0_g1_i1:128-1699(+)
MGAAPALSCGARSPLSCGLGGKAPAGLTRCSGREGFCGSGADAELREASLPRPRPDEETPIVGELEPSPAFKTKEAMATEGLDAQAAAAAKSTPKDFASAAAWLASLPAAAAIASPAALRACCSGSAVEDLNCRTCDAQDGTQAPRSGAALGDARVELDETGRIPMMPAAARSSGAAAATTPSTSAGSEEDRRIRDAREAARRREMERERKERLAARQEAEAPAVAPLADLSEAYLPPLSPLPVPDQAASPYAVAPAPPPLPAASPARATPVALFSPPATPAGFSTAPKASPPTTPAGYSSMAPKTMSRASASSVGTSATSMRDFASNAGSRLPSPSSQAQSLQLAEAEAQERRIASQAQRLAEAKAEAEAQARRSAEAEAQAQTQARRAAALEAEQRQRVRERELEQERKQAKERARRKLEQAPPSNESYYKITIDKTQGGRLGIDVAGAPDQNAAVVEAVTGGLFADWNKHHPDCQVGSGDQIVEVNGVRTYADMIDELKQNKLLNIRLLRAAFAGFSQPN